MSIRLRLSLIYTLILAIVLLVASLILYFSFFASTQFLARRMLAENAARLLPALQVDGVAEAPDLPAPSGLPGPPGPGFNLLNAAYYQISTPAGQVVSRSDNLPADQVLPLSDRGRERLTSGGAWIESATLGEEGLLVYSQLAQTQAGGPAIIQIAQSTSFRDQGLRILAYFLVVGNLVVNLLAFGIGWFMASYSLRPIKRIQQTAQAIGAERDFNRRVDYTGPNDEVGQLANTFNTMLAELQAAFSNMEQSLEAQRRFVADASHELRTPLTTISGNLDLLRCTPPLAPAEQEDVVNDLVMETERLMRLVNELLVLARADAKRPLRREPVPVKPVLEEICHQAQILDPRRTITCDSAPVSVAGDRDSLKQVLLALVDNALKYTPAAAAIALTATSTPRQVTIQVSDTGPGIDPQLLPHIFDRFYRGDAARTEGGTGLGLSIAKELVAAQQGTLEVTSELGRGTTFSLIFPAAP